MWFKAISGLKINLDKSGSIPIRSVSNVEELLASLGCKVGLLSSTWLGLPLGAAYKSTVIWDMVEKRFQRRLAIDNVDLLEQELKSFFMSTLEWIKGGLEDMSMSTVDFVN